MEELATASRHGTGNTTELYEIGPATPDVINRH